MAVGQKALLKVSDNIVGEFDSVVYLVMAAPVVYTQLELLRRPILLC